MKYISIDIETTGLDKQNHDIIEFAAVADDLEIFSSDFGMNPHKPPFRPWDLPYFHVYIYKENDLYQGSSFAFALHGEIFKKLRKRSVDSGHIDPKQYENYTTLENLNSLFVQWLYQIESENEINVAGKNFNNFDKPFLQAKLPEQWKGDNWGNVKLNYRAIDPAILYWQPGDKGIPSSQMCLERAGLKGEVAHTALEDAMLMVKLVRNKLIK